MAYKVQKFLNPYLTVRIYRFYNSETCVDAHNLAEKQQPQNINRR